MELLGEDFLKESIQKNLKKSYNELSSLLNKLNQRLSITDLMSAEEYCGVDSNLVTFDSPDADQIIKSTLSENGLNVSRN